MVDSISGLGGSQSVDVARRNAQQQEARQEQAEKKEQRADLVDTVSISDEALQKSEQLANQQAAEVRQQLGDNRQETLGLDSDFDTDA